MDISVATLATFYLLCIANFIVCCFGYFGYFDYIGYFGYFGYFGSFGSFDYICCFECIAYFGYIGYFLPYMVGNLKYGVLSSFMDM